jgi:hypothetical protein
MAHNDSPVLGTNVDKPALCGTRLLPFSPTRLILCKERFQTAGSVLLYRKRLERLKHLVQEAPFLSGAPKASGFLYPVPAGMIDLEGRWFQE